jgi:type I restriction enzyme, S subunit
MIETTLGDICLVNPKRKDELKDDDLVTFVGMADISEDDCQFNASSTRTYAEIKKGFTAFQENDVLFAKITPCMENGKAAIAHNLENGCGFGTTELIVLRALGGISSKLIYNFIHQMSFRDEAREAFTGSAGQQRVPVSFVNKHVFPLYPLEEQRRIVAKLDELLPRLKAARSRLEGVPGILASFRKAVLAAACDGRLTEEWRGNNPDSKKWNSIDAIIPGEESRQPKHKFWYVDIINSHPYLPDTWAIKRIGELYEEKVLFELADGNHGSDYPRNEDFTSTGILFLTASQIGEDSKVDISECPKLSISKAKQLKKGWARNNDVLLTHNATVGRVAILSGLSEKILLGTSATLYRFNQNYISPPYAFYFFQCTYFQTQLTADMEQTTRNQVPITKQVSLSFYCPPLPEQREIVRRVDELFALADKAEASYKAAMEKVDSIEQTILAKAFRGELVPQDPNDEPAEKILERILAEKAKLEAERPKRGRPRLTNRRTSR